MEPQHDLFSSLPADWKWHVLLDPEGPLERQWQLWLADAQRAEDEALLRYWARRAGSASAQRS